MSDYGEYADDENMLDIYGSPQYQDGGGMPGKTLAQKMSFLKSIESITGMPLVQLLGGNVQQDGPVAPYVNQTFQMYGESPLYQEAFASIDAGADPQTVMKNLLDPNIAKEFGIDKNDTTATGRIYDTLQAYARDRVQGQQYDQEHASDGESFTTSGGKTFRGDPNIMGFSSEFDLMGRPDTKMLVQEYANQRYRNNPPPTPYDVQSKMVDVPMSGGPNGPRDGRRPGEFRLSGPPVPNASGPVQGPGFSDPRFKDMIQKGIAQRVEKSKSNMIRSDANANAMRTLINLRTLLGG